MNEVISRALRAYDGKHVAPLEEASSLSPTGEDVVALLKKLESNPNYEEPGTWLLKAWAERGRVYTDEELVSWFQATKAAKHWGATLHFCQALECLRIPNSIESEVFNFLVEKTSSDNKLVRAWSYSALAYVAAQNLSHVSQVSLIIKRGQNDPAASVRARLKAVAKSMAKLTSTKGK